MDLQQYINDAWNNRALLNEEKYIQAIKATIQEIDKGFLRAAEKMDGNWQSIEWVKQPNHPR